MKKKNYAIYMKQKKSLSIVYKFKKTIVKDHLTYRIQ